MMQQTLPVRFLSMPLLSAYYAMDYEAREKGEPASGLLYRAALFLALALRLGEGEDDEARVRKFQLLADSKDPSKLKALRVNLRGEEAVQITPVQFARLRPILAAQNGIELVSPDANPELVEAERDLAAMRGPKLNYSADGLVSALAALTGTDERDIDEWPILKLKSREAAYSRILHFLVCGIGETQGTKWKGGNPYPSPFYDHIHTESGGAIPMDQFADGKGLDAVNSGGTSAPPMI